MTLTLRLCWRALLVSCCARGLAGWRTLDGMFSYSWLKGAGCVPSDFQPPSYSSCVQESNKLGANRSDWEHRYVTYRCVARLHNVRLPKRRRAGLVGHMLAIVPKLSADKHWQSRQVTRAEECLEQLEFWLPAEEVFNVSAATGADFEREADRDAVFMLACVRLQLKYECAQHVMRRYGKEIGSDDAELMAEQSLELGGQACFRPAADRNPAKSNTTSSDISILFPLVRNETAFNNCSRARGVDLRLLAGALQQVSQYIEQRRRGARLQPFSGAQVQRSGETPRQAASSYATAVVQQHRRLRDAVACTMQATGQADAHGQLEYAELRRQLAAERRLQGGGRRRLLLRLTRRFQRRGIYNSDVFIYTYFREIALLCAGQQINMMLELSKGVQ